jgi:hypothetical protein
MNVGTANTVPIFISATDSSLCLMLPRSATWMSCTRCREQLLAIAQARLQQHRLHPQQGIRYLLRRHLSRRRAILLDAVAKNASCRRASRV